MFKQSVDSQCIAQAASLDADEPFDFLEAIHRDIDKSDRSLWSEEKYDEELKKFHEHYHRAEAPWDKFTTTKQAIKSDDSWRTCAEDSFSDEADQYPDDDLYYTNTELEKSVKGDRPAEAVAPCKSEKLRRPPVDNLIENAE